jgi:predicted transcriptional regulator
MRKRTLKLQVLDRLAREMHAELIMTGRDQLTCISTGDTLKAAKSKMGENYSQLPVLEKGQVVGLLCKTHLQGTSDKQEVSTLRPQWSCYCRLAAQTALGEIPTHLCKEQALLVFDEKEGCCLGLVHFSDLNKQGFRIFLYLWLSALEMGLAELLHDLEHRKLVFSLGKAWDKISKRLESDRKHDIDLQPIEMLDLSNLINVLRKTPCMVERLHMSKKKYEEKTGHIVELRKPVMHPVRPVLRYHAQTNKLARWLEDLRCLVKAIHDVRP